MNLDMLVARSVSQRSYWVRGPLEVGNAGLAVQVGSSEGML